MIIECSACHSRYRIREEKLPPGGGNIKCPNCEQVFFVSLPPVPAEAPGEAGPATAPLAPPAPPVSAGGTMMMAAPPPVPTEQPAPAGPITGSNPAIRKWKLKNAIGLVYDFSDTDSLRRWLQARDSLDGLTASSDNGTTWEPLSKFEELSDVRPASRKTALAVAAITGGVDPRAAAAAVAAAPPPSPEKLKEAAAARLEQARQKRSEDTGKINVAAAQAAAARPDSGAPAKAGGKKKGQAALLRRNEPAKPESNPVTLVIVGLVAVLAIGGFVWALDNAGIVNFRGSSASTSMQVAPTRPPSGGLQPPTAEGTGAPGAAQAERPMTDQDRARQSLTRAAEAITAGDTQGAIANLERAAFFDPANTEVACQLAVLYLRESRNDEAAAARRRCEGGTEQPAPGDGAPDDGAAPLEGDPGEMPPGEFAPEGVVDPALGEPGAGSP
jgi:predicted Zn finger-like uncharacterized protein